MDPNANLEEQLRLANKILAGVGYASDGVRLAELVLALDHWLNTSGFLPARWEAHHAHADAVRRKRCGAVCSEQPSWVCSRPQGHTGRHESYDGGDWYDEREPCEACNGTGFVHGSCCRRCGGSMSLPKEGVS